MESIGERIRKLRKYLTLNQTVFGKNIGLPQSVVTAWECGARIPNERQIILISSYYNVNKNWLLTGDGDMFNALTPDEELTQIFKQALADDADPRRKQLVKTIMEMLQDVPDDALPIIGDYAQRLADAIHGDGANADGGAEK